MAGFSSRPGEQCPCVLQLCVQQLDSACGALQAVLVGYVVRSALGWYVRLDREALRKEAELALQDPTSLKKACGCTVAALSLQLSRSRACSQVPVPSVFDEASKALSVIVPAYNEEFRLPGTLEETLRSAGHSLLACCFQQCSFAEVRTQVPAAETRPQRRAVHVRGADRGRWQLRQDVRVRQSAKLAVELAICG